MGKLHQMGASGGLPSDRLPLPKGNQAKIPGPGLRCKRRRGRARGRRRPSRGELSFLLDSPNDPGIGSPGDRVERLAECPALFGASGAWPPTLENPREKSARGAGPYR